MPDDFEELCTRAHRLPEVSTKPAAPPLYPASVYACESPTQASKLLSGELDGFVYSRDGHPNAQILAQRCAEMHAADRAVVTGSGMAALALALLSHAQQGDHLVVSNQLYGRSLELFTSEAQRLGLQSTRVDACALDEVADAFTDRTRLVIVETIANPMLRVCDISSLADLARARGALLLVDNTLASPAVCRPLELGADLVMESITKIMNGHSDVMLGLLCGKKDAWQRVPLVHTTWGFFASPWDCWLATRGLGTLALRARRAEENALAVAEMLDRRTDVQHISYPGLASHPDHKLATRQFDGFGNLVTFTLTGGAGAAERLIAAASARIPFCPSLGELMTTLSHPESTSHRLMSDQQRAALGISGGTIRLSVGVEPTKSLLESLEHTLAATTPNSTS